MLKNLDFYYTSDRNYQHLSTYCVSRLQELYPHRVNEIGEVELDIDDAVEDNDMERLKNLCENQEWPLEVLILGLDTAYRCKNLEMCNYLSTRYNLKMPVYETHFKWI